MSDIEKQVVSLELAKKLKEAGYPQWGNSFYWVLVNDKIVLWYWKEFLLDPDRAKRAYFTAPTVAEGLERLPKTLNRKVNNADTDYKEMILPFDLDITFKDNLILIRYIGRQGITSLYLEDEDTNFSNIVHKMWLYLKENNLLEEQESER